MASQNESLALAMRVEDVDTVERLLAEGTADVNEASELDGMTPLHSAAAAGNLAWVERLLELGADPGAVDRLGKLPTHYARGEVRRLLGEPPARPARTSAARTTLDTALALLPRLGAGEATFSTAYNPADEDEVPTHTLQLFDCRKLLGPGNRADRWLTDTFCDGFLDGYLDDDDDGKHWAHPDTVPFAFVLNEESVDDDGLPSSPSAFLCFELAQGDGKTCPVSFIRISGTAISEINPLAASVEALGIR